MLAHPCGSMIKKCYWQSEEVQCTNIFESVKTSQGYCCAFNYYGTVEAVYNLEDPQKLHHQYVGGAGPSLGLRLLLDVEEDQYTSSIKPAYGINVLVQDGFDYPNMDLIANTILSTEELTISVTPRVYVSTDTLRRMNYKQRNCLFEDEGHLEWTSTYSYKTCVSQCRVRSILQYCNCVPFYYPIKNSTIFCTLLDVPCLQENRYKYTALELLNNPSKEKPSPTKMVRCNCYPQCNEQMFDFHVDRAKATPMIGFDYSNVSIVNVYYTTIGCIKTERDVYFTWDRILASIGGIFGLCLGGSVISILECFYFFGKQVSNCKSIKIEPKSKKSLQQPIYVSDFKLYNYKDYSVERNYNNIKRFTSDFKN